MDIRELISPNKTLILPLVVSFLIWLSTPLTIFEEAGGFSKYSMSLKSCVVFVGFIVLIYLGQFLGRKMRFVFFSNNKHVQDLQSRTFWYFLMGFGFVSVGAYFVWFYRAFRYGLNKDIFLNAKTLLDLKTEYMEPAMVQGVTILTQVAIPVLIFLYINRRNFGYSKMFKYFFPTLLGFSLLRVFLNSERTALIELVFPLLILKFYFDKRLFKPIKVVLVLTVIIILFLLFFTFTESLRSFPVKTISETSPLLYSVHRLMIYFIAPVNYSFFIIDNIDIGLHGISHILQWWLTGFTNQFGIQEEFYYFGFLWNSSYANFEFNNVGGIGALFLDVGIFSLILIFLYAVVVGYLYELFKNDHYLGISLYPFFVLANLGFFNTLHFGTSRGLVPLLVAVFVLLLTRFINGNFIKVKIPIRG